MTDVDRDIGRLEGRVEAVQLTLERMEKDMANVQETLQQAKGGWRLMIAVGSGAAAIGSALTALWATLRH